jgi:hypothetical protein
MNSKLLPILFASLISSSACKADSFQFVDAHTGAFASFSKVEIDKAPVGYTDQLGRITISRTPGAYVAIVNFLGHPFQVQLAITGDTSLRRVVFNQ